MPGKGPAADPDAILYGILPRGHVERLSAKDRDDLENRLRQVGDDVLTDLKHQLRKIDRKQAHQEYFRFTEETRKLIDEAASRGITGAEQIKENSRRRAQSS